MQTDFELLDLLKVPFLYNLVQDCIGGNALRRRFIKSHVRAKAGDKVIDIGCGPAQIMPWLPAVEYLGFDVSEAYIVSAKRKYIVTALGILHHLDDEEAAHCLRFAYHALKTGGRFVSLDACWVPNQGRLSRYIMSKDRGQNVRTEQAYRHLAEHVFQNVTSLVDMKPLRIPYVTVVLECEK